MKAERIERNCPKCGRRYTSHSAVSRVDNITLVCPDCGIREALESLGVNTEEQDRILETIHRTAKEE